MFRILLVVVAALLVGLGIGWLFQEDRGYVQIILPERVLEVVPPSALADNVIEINVLVGLGWLLVAAIVFALLVWALLKLIALPRKAKAASRRRRGRGAARDLAHGIRALEEGRWGPAEVLLTKRAAHSETPVVHYTLAARAAQHLQAEWRRNDYFRKTEDAVGRDAMVVGLTKAELLLADDKPAAAQHALAPLESLYSRQPPQWLKLQALCLRRLGEWAKLKAILPKLEQANIMTADELRALQREVYTKLLAEASARGSVADLNAIWREIPTRMQDDEEVRIAYIIHLRDNDAVDRADAMLREALHHNWNEKLITLYGQLGRGNATAQLRIADEWLKQHGKNPHLLLTMGRLARRSRQLGVARAHLEESIRAMATPDAYQELGRVFEEQDNKDMAYRCYREGLRLLTGQQEDKEASEVLLGKETTPTGQSLTQASGDSVPTQPQTAT